MGKIIPIQSSPKIISIIRSQGKKIVIIGGCFDILHVGHIRFIKAAKQQGDILILLLESDARVTMLKGKSRPINKQSERAEMLESISDIDYIIPLPLFVSDTEYDKLIFELKPAIIATTKSDQYKLHKNRQAALVGAQVVEVIDRIQKYATTKIEKLL
jgi:rfaE bifunctional protein nucleotidyltransferase chain/domain